ncbi:hypothetical protein THAOC_13879, partial [Thalassiosira oceanica]
MHWPSSPDSTQGLPGVNTLRNSRIRADPVCDCTDARNGTRDDEPEVRRRVRRDLFVASRRFR